MPQAKFSLSETQMEFINRHERWGFPDRSSLVRFALDQMKDRLAQQRLAESAQLYAEVFAEEDELRELTDAGLGDWPR